MRACQPGRVDPGQLFSNVSAQHLATFMGNDLLAEEILQQRITRTRGAEALAVVPEE